MIATSKPDDEQRLRGYGAAETLDYVNADVAATVRERYPKGVKGLIDTVNQPDGLNAMAELVREGGAVATPATQPDADELAKRSISTTLVMASPEPAQLARVAAHVDAGDLLVPIQSVHPLEQALDAFAQKARGTHGKLAISIVG